ncbi:MAG TPA: D-2-hydroxyacid dehydrogenase [Sunxiuqinia sp.]|nr:D-2-hydroxyacid dehydrogenase [Sunxiuqinia sp.]
MRIVVLDGYTLNPGDLSWEPLKAFGEVTVYDRTPSSEIESRLTDAEIALTNKVPLWHETIEKLPNLKYIGILATGYNVVDMEAAHERKIPVTNIPAYSTESVAQQVFAHLLNLTNHITEHAQQSPQKWPASADFSYWDFPLVELQSLTMGVVGFGSIGRATARLATAFGMKVLLNTRTRPKDVPDGVTLTDLDTLFLESDVVSLHCPLTADTQEMVNKERLVKMKSSAFLINTGRGPLINEQDLADALNNGQIAGAGLDVLSKEPADPNNPLLTAKNCYITPHIAWATKASRSRLMKIAIENVRQFLAGNPQNVVNGI